MYEFDPIIDSMTVAETKHILGGQANLWAEYIPNNSQSEYMIYPRLAAMAEVLWSPKELRDWNDFSSRITTMFERYKELDINYAKSIYLVNPTTEVDLDKKEVYLSLINEFSNSDIRYVLGNQNINENAIKYTKPLGFKETTIVKASLFKNNKPIGKIFLDTIKFHNAVACKVNYISPYDDNYKGAEALGLVNLIRGTKNHHDGQWQAWLKKDMEVIIDLENEKTIKEVTMGSIENQGRNIYFPNTIEVYASTDGVNYTKIAKTEHFFAINPISELKDFKMSFEKTTARFLKISATNIKTTPKGTDAWLFVDEILVN